MSFNIISKQIKNFKKEFVVEKLTLVVWLISILIFVSIIIFAIFLIKKHMNSLSEALDIDLNIPKNKRVEEKQLKEIQSLLRKLENRQKINTNKYLIESQEEVELTNQSDNNDAVTGL